MFDILKRSEDSGVPELEPVSDASASSCDQDAFLSLDTQPLNVPLEVGGDEFREHPLVGSKQVSFGNVEIRKYPLILGDHPECCLGPPVTIDWEPFRCKCFSIDYYESKRSTRRSLNELKMGWIQRKQVLRKTDVATDEEMRQAACEAQRVRDQRYRTVKNLRYECLQLPIEAVTRKVKRAFDRRR